MGKRRGILQWLGAEANSRAIGALLAIGVAIGGALAFLTERVLPMYSPAFSLNNFGEGFRRGQRELELERRVLELEASIALSKRMDEIWRETNQMSEEKLNKALQEP